jgi:UDPglucose--hexose-1-phosphate uridylyltransferase
MAELRRDPVIGRWVIISTERASRPDQYKDGADKDEGLGSSEKCPFCEGNESMTAPEICAMRRPGSKPNGPGWEVRVVPSIMPLLHIEGDVDRHGHGMYDLMAARGAHEIVIETPIHADESSASVEQLTKAINVTLDRITDLERDPRIKYVLCFKNYGKAAGGGHIKHSRIQLIGTPVNLKRVKEELVGAKTYYDYKERCLFCDIIKQELASGKRIVAENKAFVAIAQFASRFPYETWILPKKHSSDFYKINRSDVPEFAALMKDVLSRMRKVLGDFPYNFVLHTAPFRREAAKKHYWQTIDQDYHWHFEILPILTRVAGFEWGSGFYINPVPPETAARSLSEAKV